MSDIKIISLGGVREDGKNMYLVEVNDLIFVLDCGLIYPPDEMLGIDAMIPDFTYLIENKERIAGVFLTHGHADAIGALPYLLREVKVPVFGTELTIGLAKLECQRLGVKNFKEFYVINQTNEIEFDQVVVKFFNTTHSVPESIGISVKTEEGAIVYTGDYKFDMTVNENYRTDFARINEIAQDGVLALLSESQQAESYFENTTEYKIETAIEKQVRKASGRVIVASVDSNIMRLQQVLDVAEKTKRHVFLSGGKVEKIIDAAIRLDKLTIPSSDLIVDIHKIGQYKDEQIIVLETGKASEPLFALQRMAQGNYGNVSVEEGDLVLLATSQIFGMEKIVADTLDYIYRAGGHAIEISSNFKSSGHATPRDLQLMIQLLKPKYVIPVSGEYRLMYAYRDLAMQAGIAQENIFLLEKGDVLRYENDNMYLSASIPATDVLIDGSGVGDIGNIVLRDRRVLSEDGIFVVVLTISRQASKILVGPEIISRGFIYVKKSTDLVDESKDIVINVVDKSLKDKENFEWSKLKTDIRDALSKYLFEQTRRRPMILPVTMEASNHRKQRNFKNK